MFLFLLFSILVFQVVNSNQLKNYENSSLDEYDLSGLRERTREKRFISFNKFERNEVKVSYFANYYSKLTIIKYIF